jgi:hypothetical protein
VGDGGEVGVAVFAIMRTMSHVAQLSHALLLLRLGNSMILTTTLPTCFVVLIFLP